jgi:DNA-binding beta-propeller fold protein YncE
MGVELALCQRYLPAFNGVGTVDDVGWGMSTTTSAALIGFTFPVEPRVAPTGIAVNSVGNFSLTTAAVQSVVTALTFNVAGKRMCRLSVTGTGAPYVASQPAILFGNTAGAQILFTGAEL